ncbi:hypothetical protein [Streptomyces sp. NPDC006879]|uniref:hypothetical protein n=1 Tax=Streptomyces sp. NPDC006879 TaxID=3364767 RepID=UPI0036A9B5B0
MGAIRTAAPAVLAVAAALCLGATATTGLFTGSAGPATSPAGAAPVVPVQQTDTPFGFALTPSVVAPGGSVTLSVTDCDASFATASSGVFDTVSVPRGQTVDVTVDRDARRGAVYSVTFTCDRDNGSTELTISGGTSTPTTSSTSRPRPLAPTATPTRSASLLPVAPPAPAATRYPSASRTSAGASLGVRGGLGGSSSTHDVLQLAAGACLFLTATAGTGYVLRRRSGAGRHQ